MLDKCGEEPLADGRGSEQVGQEQRLFSRAGQWISRIHGYQGTHEAFCRKVHSSRWGMTGGIPGLLSAVQAAYLSDGVALR